MYFSFLENVQFVLAIIYLLENVRLVWETAYATSYDLMLSGDAVDYEIVYAATDAKGGTQTITLPKGSKGQYLRLLCKTRSTGYGSSLYEIEVYGSGRCEPIVITGVETVADRENSGNQNPNTGSAACKLLRDGRLYIQKDGIFYSITGEKVLF